MFLFDLDSALKSILRAAEIDRLFGDIESLFFDLNLMAEIFIEQGHLKSVEATLAEFLQRSNPPQSRVEEFLADVRSMLLSPRGKWRQAQAYYRQQLDKLHQGKNLQEIEGCNFNLAGTILERNRFGDLEDLSEAEAALRENIDIYPNSPAPRFHLISVLAREGRFTEAHEMLTEAIESLAQPVYRAGEVWRLAAEAELALAEGRWDEVISTCQTLIEFDQQGSWRWNQARRLIDLGDALLGRDGPGDRQRAQEVFQQSLEMFTEMGAPGYIQVLEDRLGNL